MTQLDRAAAAEASGMMPELAAPTGGRFIQNINDLAGAFRRLNSPSEYTCLPGFTPEKLKFVQSFHALKVELSKNENLTLQAAFAIMPQALATASFSTFFCWVKVESSSRARSSILLAS